MYSIEKSTADAATGIAGRALAIMLAAAFTATALAVVAPTPQAFAGSGQDLAPDATRHVSISLNKSIVVRLPVAARDVLIGNPAVVEAVVRTQNTAYLFAKTIGQTNAFFFDAQGRQILSLDIDVSHDTRSLMDLIGRTIPGSRITADSVGENIVLKGIAANAAEARLAFDLAARYTGDEKKVLSTISVTGKDQVLLRVRVAEVQREVLKQFGIDTAAAISVGSKFALKWATLNPFSVNGLLSPGFLGGTYDASASSAGCVVSATADGGCALMTAMERDGLMRTLAEPTLTAISGESAKFLAGGEFPYQSCTGALNNLSCSIEFKPYGVGLGFSPVVLSEGRISLRISTEVSELSQENAVNGNPSLKVRRAETTVELPSGGSMALAGLIQERSQQAINGTPGLKDLPVLGALFRSRDFQSNQTELVVIVTPFVVSAVNEKQLTTPLDRLNNADDSQTILFGRLNKVYGVAGDAPKGVVYHGNVGFIVE